MIRTAFVVKLTLMHIHNTKRLFSVYTLLDSITLFRFLIYYIVYGISTLRVSQYITLKRNITARRYKPYVYICVAYRSIAHPETCCLVANVRPSTIERTIRAALCQQICARSHEGNIYMLNTVRAYV